MNHILALKCNDDDFLSVEYEYSIEKVRKSKNKQIIINIRKPTWVTFEGEEGESNESNIIPLSWEVVKQKFS